MADPFDAFIGGVTTAKSGKTYSLFLITRNKDCSNVCIEFC